MYAGKANVKTCSFVVAEVEAAVGRGYAFICPLPVVLEVVDSDIRSYLFLRHLRVSVCRFLKQETSTRIFIWCKLVGTFKNLSTGFSVANVPNIIKQFAGVTLGSKS